MPGAGRCQRSPEEPENRARENPKTGPGRNRRNPRSPEGAREARKEPNENEGPVARRVPRLFCLLVLPVVRRSLAGLWLTVGRSLAGCSADYICRLLPVLTGFQAVPPVVGWSLTRSFAGRLSVACRDFPGCQLLRRLFAGSSPVLSVGAAVPRTVLRPLADFVCRACSVGSVGSIGPLVRRVHWRRRGSVDARTLPRPAPSACIEAAEKRAAARFSPGRKMHPTRTSGPDADNGSSPHSKPACADLLRPEHPRTGCSLSGRLHSGRPLRTHFCRPLRPGRSVPDALLQTAPLRTHSFGPPRSGCPAQAAPFRPSPFRPSPLRRETPRDGS